jgi:divalent metal cation (Fe/Co/Zn/Cd) transporter
VIAFLGILLSHLFGLGAIDGIAAMCIGALLACVAVLLLRESRSLIVGESADRGLVDRLRQLLASDPSVHRVGGILTMHFGPDRVVVNAQVEFQDPLRSDDLERAIDRIQARVRAACPIVERIFVELETLSRKTAPARGGFGPAS